MFIFYCNWITSLGLSFSDQLSNDIGDNEVSNKNDNEIENNNIIMNDIELN